MTHGGKRDGAGRRRGVHNKATARREQLIAQTGPTPVDIMINIMRCAFDMAQRELNQKEPNEAKVKWAFGLALELHIGPRHLRTLGFPQSITAQRSMSRN